jgi:hypothetical protein
MKRNRTVVLVMSVTVLAGCMSSGTQEISLNIDAQPETFVLVMPFAAAQERFATREGIYTYKFDDQDYANLRKSIIESLQKNGSFKGVQDVSHETEIVTGTSLYVSFEESGMGSASWGKTACTLRAFAWTEDVTGNVMAEKEITVVETSVAVRAAKNKAIAKFVQELSGLFVTN